MINNREIGHYYEDMACEYLKSQGHIIKHRNFNTRSSEIDIVSMEKQKNNYFGIENYLVFTEVKFRSDNFHGEPYEAVSLTKQKRIKAAAKYYMYINKYPTDFPVRFDVISIKNNGIEWIKNAFS